MKHAPDEQFTKNSESSNARWSTSELIYKALGSWTRTLRLVVLLCVSSIVPVAFALISITGITKFASHAVSGSKASSASLTILFVVSLVIVVLAGVLLLVSKVAARSAVQRVQTSQAKQDVAAMCFIQALLRLEITATKLVADQLGEPPDVVPLGIVLRGLEEQGIWSQGEIFRFRELLRIRNSLVHDQKAVKNATLKSAMADAEHLGKELSRTPERGDSTA